MHLLLEALLAVAFLAFVAGLLWCAFCFVLVPLWLLQGAPTPNQSPTREETAALSRAYRMRLNHTLSRHRGIPK